MSRMTRIRCTAHWGGMVSAVSIALIPSTQMSTFTSQPALRKIQVEGRWNERKRVYTTD